MPGLDVVPEIEMKRVVAILITFSVAAVAALWLQSLLGTSPSFAGDGGPNFGWMLQVITLAAIALVSGLIGSCLLWRLAVVSSESRPVPEKSNDAPQN